MKNALKMPNPVSQILNVVHSNNLSCIKQRMKIELLQSRHPQNS